jgi:hypothetical protein
MSSGINPTVLQILEKYTGKKVRVIIERSFGFEGTVATISQEPPGIWLSDAEAVIISFRKKLDAAGVSKLFETVEHFGSVFFELLMIAERRYLDSG